MMNIDQQIREILSKSCPVNDNRPLLQKNDRNLPHTLTRSISVVGSHNIIVSSDMLLLGFLLLLGAYNLLNLIH